MLVPGNEICKKLVFMFGYRVMSRVCVVPFLKPSITAATDRELRGVARIFLKGVLSLVLLARPFLQLVRCISHHWQPET